jgi:hypothetical protein
MTKLILDGGAALYAHPTCDLCVGASLAGAFVRCEPQIFAVAKRRAWNEWRRERLSVEDWFWVVVETAIEEQFRSRAEGA